MGKGGCALFLFVIGVLALEAFVAWKLAEIIGQGQPEYLGVILSAVGLSIAGYQLLRWRIRNMAAAMLGGQPGKAMAGSFGAVLLIFPGFITGFCGALMQIPAIQGIFGKTIARIAQAYLAKNMGKMQGGRFGGGPGGFPGGGFPPGGFPGGFPGMQPDDQVGGKGKKKTRTKTIDTTAEREQ